jgi:hypothetical protein
MSGSNLLFADFLFEGYSCSVTSFSAVQWSVVVLIPRSDYLQPAENRFFVSERKQKGGGGGKKISFMTFVRSRCMLLLELLRLRRSASLFLGWW